MKFQMVKSKEALAQKAYDILVDVIGSKDSVTLGLATGSSPEGIYELFRANKPDVSHVSTVNLDEYIGLAGDHEQSYQHFMNVHLFNHLPFKETYVPNGVAADLEAECARYDEILARHPVDLQLLGIGANGHIAFNEPGMSFDKTTHIADLVESTIEANSRYFASKSDVPTRALSMGIKSIMEAKQILLIASGTGKAQAIKDLMEMDVTQEMPATVLKNHPNVTIIIDEEAASLLTDEQKQHLV